MEGGREGGREGEREAYLGTDVDNCLGLDPAQAKLLEVNDWEGGREGGE